MEGSSAVVMTTTCQDYQLSSVIMHHGLGFQSGHYTTYSWNSEAGIHYSLSLVMTVWPGSELGEGLSV